MLEQTVEIPESRHIVLDVPPEVPVGRSRVVFFPLFDKETTLIADWRRLRGKYKDSGFSSEALSKERAIDNLREEVKTAVQFNRDPDPKIVELSARHGVMVETLKAEGKL